MAMQRIDNPDGSYSIAFYQDDNGNDASFEDATIRIINEYDKDGNVTESTFQRRGPEPEGDKDV